MIQLYRTLDLRPIGIPQTLRLSQYDSDFEIIFELTNFDGAWILDTNTTAEIQGTKTDGHGYSADAVFDDQLKTVTIAGDVQMTAAAGRNVFEVVLFHDGDRLGSKNFILDVERAALDAETTQSDSQIKNFTDMVEAAEDAAETATAAAETASASETAAVEAAESVTASAAQITQNASDIADISVDVERVYITPDLNTTYSGVTFKRQQDGSLALWGTATATRRFLCLNGQNGGATTSTSFKKTLPAGKYAFSQTWETPGTAAITWSYTYTTFASANPVVTKINPTATLTFTNDVMIGFSMPNGSNFGTEENPTVICLSAKQLSAKDVKARAAAEAVKDAVLYTVQSLTSAQQTQARDNIDAVGNDILYQYNGYDALSLGNGPGGEHNGVTFTKNSDGTWTINGTASANAWANIITSTTSLPRYITPGRRYYFGFHGGSVPVQVYLYKDGSSSYYSSETYTEDFELTIPEDLTGIIIRFFVESGATVSNETVKYTFTPSGSSGAGNSCIYNIANTYALDVSPTITTDTNGWLASVDTDTADETGKMDMTPAIMAMLQQTGYCHLGEGIFYVSGNIDMPEGSTLEGCGRSSIIRLLSSVEAGYAIKIERYNTISNVKIEGERSTTSKPSQGTRTGVLFKSNDDGQEGETERDSQCCMMSNVWIGGFSDSGLKCHNTSMSVNRGLYAVNLYIVTCWAGLNIDYRSEFNKFVNYNTTMCQYGCINNGGNNVFTSCTFGGYSVGFYIDGTKRNSAHGTINGCTFCHVGSNTGKAIQMEDVVNGFVVSECQVWYCSIDLTDCTGIAFVGCEFGRGTTGEGATINVSGGALIMFNGCMFMNDINNPPDITITNNDKVKFDACYGSASGNAITA